MSIKKIHFVGIGGIGISALARYMQSKGISITGSDVSEGVITKQLKEAGIIVQIPHDSSIINDQDLIIHSSIIKSDNVELQKAMEKNIKIMSRKESLKWILKDTQVYAVAGAHGKSTTSAILSSIMQHANSLIGALSKEFDSNVRVVCDDRACDNVVVFEADESDKSFLNCNPYCAIVTNAEPEHMETYEHNLELFYGAYREFLLLAKKRVINAEDSFLGSLDIPCVKLYPSKDISDVSYILDNNIPKTKFRLTHKDIDYGYFECYGIGKHIALDASLAILSVVDCIGLDEIRENIKKFVGIKKRFDILCNKSCVIIDDYAHHPTEISTTIKALKIYQNLIKADSLCGIWQPHKYSRLCDNLDSFVECFYGLDRLIILPVYCVGEERREIDFEKLFAKYNPIFADYVKRVGDSLEIYKDNKKILSLNSGIMAGFNAGDLTYQLRGGI